MVRTRRRFGKRVVSIVTIGAIAGCGGDSGDTDTTTTDEPTTTTTDDGNGSGGPNGGVEIVSSNLSLEGGTATLRVTVSNNSFETTDATVEVSVTVTGGESYTDSTSIGLHSADTQTVEFTFDVTDSASEDDIQYQTTLA